jgi:hypothetical protein
MNFYSIFFWWSVGLMSGIVLSFLFGVWWWRRASARGVVAIKDDNGKWLGLDLPQNAPTDGKYEKMAGLLHFAVTNKDKFTEWDPDLVKHQWIESAEEALGRKP